MLVYAGNLQPVLNDRLISAYHNGLHASGFNPEEWKDLTQASVLAKASHAMRAASNLRRWHHAIVKLASKGTDGHAGQTSSKK